MFTTPLKQTGMSAFATAPPPPMEMETKPDMYQQRKPSNESSLCGDICFKVFELSFISAIGMLITAMVILFIGNIYYSFAFTHNVNQVFLKQTETFFQLSTPHVSPESLVIYGGFSVPEWKDFSSFRCSIAENTPAKLGTFAEMCDISSFDSFLKLSTCSPESCAPFNQTLNIIYTNFFQEYCAPNSFRKTYQYEVFYPQKCNGIVVVGYYEHKRREMNDELSMYPLVGWCGVWVVGLLGIIVKNLLCSSRKYQPLPQEDTESSV